MGLRPPIITPMANSIPPARWRRTCSASRGLPPPDNQSIMPRAPERPISRRSSPTTTSISREFSAATPGVSRRRVHRRACRSLRASGWRGSRRSARPVRPRRGAGRRRAVCRRCARRSGAARALARRRMRVSLEALQLGRVGVAIAKAPALDNVALGRSAWQSSVSPRSEAGDLRRDAERGNNGDTARKPDFTPPSRKARGGRSISAKSIRCGSSGCSRGNSASAGCAGS